METLALLVVGIVILLSPATAQDAPPWDLTEGTLVTAPPGSPPSRLWDTNFAREWVAPSPHQRGKLSFSTGSMFVRVDWYSAAFINSPNHTVDSVEREIQTIAVPFYPTDVILIDDRHVLVAGKGRGSSTVIEHWTLKWPKIMPLPNFGSSKVPAHLPKVVTRTEVLRTDVPGRQLVNKMSRVRGRTDVAMVHFDDSRDLMIVDIQTGDLTLIASLSGATSLGAIPQLADDHQFIWTGDHLTLGHVYVCGSSSTKPVSFPRPDALVLVDSDKDGVIDSTLTIPVAIWDQSILADFNQYVDVDR